LSGTSRGGIRPQSGSWGFSHLSISGGYPFNDALLRQQRALIAAVRRDGRATRKRPLLTLSMKRCSEEENQRAVSNRDAAGVASGLAQLVNNVGGRQHDW